MGGEPAIHEINLGSPNREGTCKWWALAVDRNVDGGYATQVKITGET